MVQPRFDTDVIDEYLAGRLNGDMLDEFEQALFEDRRLQEEVEVQIALREGLKDQQAALLDPPGRPSLLDRVTSLLTTPQWGYGALAAVLVLSVFIVSPREKTPAFVDQVIYVDAVRSADPKPIDISAGAPAMLSIDVFAFESRDIEVLILRDGKVVRQLGRGRANSQNVVNVVLPPLDRGEFDLALESEGVPGARYQLRVR